MSGSVRVFSRYSAFDVDVSLCAISQSRYYGAQSAFSFGGPMQHSNSETSSNQNSNNCPCHILLPRLTADAGTVRQIDCLTVGRCRPLMQLNASQPPIEAIYSRSVELHVCSCSLFFPPPLLVPYLHVPFSFFWDYILKRSYNKLAATNYCVAITHLSEPAHADAKERIGHCM